MNNFRSIANLVVLVLLFLSFGALGGADHSVDRTIVEWLATVRASHPGLTSTAIVITMLGSAYATIGAGVVACAYLFATRRIQTGLLLLSGVLLERVCMDGLKLLVARDRPSFDDHPVMTHSYSYPSGHSANTMAVFTMIALAVAPPRYRMPAVAAAVILSILIGLTRPYLGVHWPTDVLGGWTLGLIAVWLFLRAAERLGVAPKPQHQIVGGHGAPLDEHQSIG